MLFAVNVFFKESLSNGDWGVIDLGGKKRGRGMGKF